jgi:hypothetical protein
MQGFGDPMLAWAYSVHICDIPVQPVALEVTQTWIL